MTTFVLVHGAQDDGWVWHLVAAGLESRGHTVVAPDLPVEDDVAFTDYADVVLRAVPSAPGRTTVVGHSLGAFTAPLVAAALPADRLVLVAPMMPCPGERPHDWWASVGHDEAVAAAAVRDGGLTGHDDPQVCFLHDVPPRVTAEALRRRRTQSNAPMEHPWPGPDLTGRAEVVIGVEDRFFPVGMARRLASERAGTAAHEVPAGHYVPLSAPHALIDLLEDPR